MLVHAYLFTGTEWTILTRKVRQAGLVFGARSGFISRSVHARLQVSVCSGYDLCHNIQTDTQTAFWPAYMNSSASRAKIANVKFVLSLTMSSI